MADIQAWVDEVSRENAMEYTRNIAQWVRLSGSYDERKAFDYIAETLNGFGIPTTLHEPTCLVSIPISGRIEIAGESIEPCITHAYGLGTPEAGIAGQLVYAGRGTFEELLAVGATGKIALTDGLARPEKAHAATQAGVHAVINISGDQLHEMIVSPIWGSPTTDTLEVVPEVVMLSIDTEGGNKLKTLLDDGEVRARVFADVDTGWKPIPVLTAEIEGDTEDFVLFSGHVDSWHYGAMDNATANATMIETARILKEHEDDLLRGMRLAFWSGHSHARYAGSTWYADAHWFDLNEHCVAHVNVDSTGAVGATTLSLANTMAETYGFARELVKKHTGEDLVYRRFGRAGDQSFWGIGIPALFMSLSEQGEADAVSAEQAAMFGGVANKGGLGWFWHTTEDTLDKIEPAHLERDVRVYVDALGHLTTDPVLPLDPRAVVDEMLAALDEIEAEWADLPAATEADAIDFAALRHELGDVHLAAEHLLAAASGDVIDDDAALVSEGLLGASKALMPVNYTRAGRFDHDLALPVPVLPSLRAPMPLVAMSDDEQWAAAHALRRALNGVRAAVREAAAHLEVTADWISEES